MKTNSKNTICAIATPPGTGGVGIIRISGPKTTSILKKIWSGKQPVSSFETHKMYLGHIHPPKLQDLRRTPYAVRNTDFIDQVLAVIMKTPNSYTGEDVAEISCHGGQRVLAKILEACLLAGAKMAGPGEFTKRAFLNGKMDLAQAEAVADLVAATSESACLIASNQLEGKLSKKIENVSQLLTQLRTFIEASIDFPEEDIDFIKKEGVGKKLKHISNTLCELANTYTEGRILRNGVNVAIIGKPNAGKSSLFNALLGHEHAIVHHTSGTTRDLVKETVQFGGIAFHLTDTAGLRQSRHEVEKIGIEKAHKSIKKADIILLILDATKLYDADYKGLMKNLDAEKTIVCINKIDLKLRMASMARASFIYISALHGNGIDRLKTMLINKVLKENKNGDSEGVVIANARHKEAIDDSISEINKATDALKKEAAPEFIAHHLNLAHESLGKITGRVTSETILNEIFSRFCIGK